MDKKRGRIFLHIGKVYWMELFISTLGDTPSKGKNVTLKNVSLFSFE